MSGTSDVHRQQPDYSDDWTLERSGRSVLGLQGADRPGSSRQTIFRFQRRRTYVSVSLPDQSLVSIRADEVITARPFLVSHFFWTFRLFRFRPVWVIRPEMFIHGSGAAKDQSQERRRDQEERKNTKAGAGDAPRSAGRSH